jgi:hypothetical protein
VSSKSVEKAKEVLSSREATRVQKNHAASVLLGNGWSPEVIKAVAAKGADPESRKRYWRVHFLRKTLTDPASTAEQRKIAAEQLSELGVPWEQIRTIAQADPRARKFEEKVQAHGAF